MRDNIFQSWKDQHPTLDPAIPLERKGLGWYSFRNVPYQYTVFDFTDYNENKRWRNIKLCNDGYNYEFLPIPLITTTRHGNIHGWNNFTEHLHELPKMMEYFEQHCGSGATGKLWYNPQKRRIDVQCYGENGFNIVVTFEPGYRNEDHNFPAAPIRPQRTLVRSPRA